jgi:hypothetical protein
MVGRREARRLSQHFAQAGDHHMGYYIRVLGTNLIDIPIQRLRERASPALIEADESATDAWQQLVLRHPLGPEIAVIEKNLVTEGELGSDELKEFLDEIPSYRPKSAVIWLQRYLPTVKVVYAFQLLSGTDVLDGWSPLHAVYNTVWELAGGILQADGEGFSNEEGYTILWQFGETVTGEWNVGVLIDGAWKHFQIDLGNQQHREAFWNGDAPPQRSRYN